MTTQLCERHLYLCWIYKLRFLILGLFRFRFQSTCCMHATLFEILELWLESNMKKNNLGKKSEWKNLLQRFGKEWEELEDRLFSPREVCAVIYFLWWLDDKWLPTNLVRVELMLKRLVWHFSPKHSPHRCLFLCLNPIHLFIHLPDLTNLFTNSSLFSHISNQLLNQNPLHLKNQSPK